MIKPTIICLCGSTRFTDIMLVHQWVFVLNVDGYIGESTRNEIEYAEKTNTPVRYLEVEK